MEDVFLEVSVVLFVYALVETHKHAVCQDEKSALRFAGCIALLHLHEVHLNWNQIFKWPIECLFPR